MPAAARLVEECFWELSTLLDVQRTARDGWIEIACEGAGDLRNGVLRAELADDDADEVIEATIARYRTPFRWHVGPSARPHDLGARLLARGFSRLDTLAGMCIHTARDVADPDPAIVVTELAPEDEAAFADVIFSTYDAPPGARERLLDEIRRSRAGSRQRHFVARLAGRVVGATSYARMAGGGFLQGAAVLEASRGRGVYRQMIQTRLEALRADGIDLAVVTAREGTSAPICARLGFDRVCTIDVYRHA